MDSVFAARSRKRPLFYCSRERTESSRFCSEGAARAPLQIREISGLDFEDAGEQFAVSKRKVKCESPVNIVN